MKNLTIEVVRDGNIEQCRELCNELMAFQKTQAIMLPEVFDKMNFDTRMRKSYESAEARHVAVVRDGMLPVGYVFSTVEKCVEGPVEYPEWIPWEKRDGALGFYPNWENLPSRVGCLSNLYFRDAYRGMGLGTRLLDISLDWFRSLEDIDLVFIYISNGNDAAMNFYLKNGFAYSHDVFGGFIKAVFKRLTPSN